MDWDPAASWDLAELEHDAGAAAPGPPSSGVHQRHVNAVSAGGCRVPAWNGGGGRAECSVHLKLGGLVGGCELGHGAADRRNREPAAAGKAAAPASSTGVAAACAGASRRPRPAGGGGHHQCPSCAVDGCKADLARCRDYHRRHKVCEAHSKTPVVVVAGREMRFCQQCSRFHLLAEFDETKRSCRKRLDGHNRRRRKPQLDPMTTASFFTSQQGTRFSPFTITTPRPTDATWPGILKTEESPYYAPRILQEEGSSNRQHFGVGSTPAYAKEGRRFPFLQEEGEIGFATGVAAASAVCQPLLKTVAAPPESGGGGGGSKVDFSDGLSRVLDSDCALSLLSAPGSSSGVGVLRMVRPTEQVPPMAPQPLVPGLQFGGSPPWFWRPHQAAAAAATGMVSEQQLNSVLGGASDGVFHVGGEGSSDGTSSSLPFAWQ